MSTAPTMSPAFLLGAWAARARGVEPRRRHRVVCNLDVPEGFAMEAFRFALSPPALGVAGLAAAALLATQLRLGPAVDPSAAPDAGELFIVRWTAMEGGAGVESPDGRVILMEPGENIAKFQKREECSALCRKLEKVKDVTGGSVVRVNGNTVRMEMRFPKYIDALDARQVTRDQKDSEDVWNEYIRGFLDNVDVEWISFSRRKLELGRDIIIDSGDQNCRLCNGAGRKKCFRCQGLSNTKADVTCDICKESGYLPCEWCTGK